MKIIWALPRLLVLTGILFLPSNALSAPKHFFDGLVGNWNGKGFVNTSADAKEEAVRCRLRNKMDNKKSKINIRGNCSIGGVLIPMTGWIQQKGKSKKYTASLFKSLAFLRIDQFTGRLKGSHLSLNFKGEDKINKEKIAVSISIVTKSANKFFIALSGTDEKTRKLYKIGTIKFSRK